MKKLAPSAPAVPARAKSGRPITSAELSRKLGLSPTTVSFVLNGLAEEKKIAAKTAARVLAAAKKYHYVPNPFARSLLKQRSEVIGVILGNFKMDYAEAVMQGMQGVLDNSSRIPFVAMHGFDAERNRKELLSSFARRDEGIIAFPLPGCDDVYRRIMDARVPLVLLGDVMPGLEYISSVTWDAEAAARVAVRHLLDTGRRRIAFLGVDYPGIGNLHRFKVYQAALHEAGLKVRRQWVATPRPMQQAAHPRRSKTITQRLKTACAAWPSSKPSSPRAKPMLYGHPFLFNPPPPNPMSRPVTLFTGQWADLADQEPRD